jgi:hypothetical protein
MTATPSDTPHVTLTTFAEYLTARPSARIDCVRQQIKIYEQDYQRGPMFYREFVEAVLRGRTAGADHLVLKRAVQAQRNDVRREHYENLAEHWLALSDLHLPVVSHGRALWVTQRLTVRIRPDLTIQDAMGNTYTLKLWLKEAELTADAAQASLRLLERHMAEIHDGATPLVVDVRREKVHRQSRRRPKRGYDDWLESEADALGGLWLRLAAAA